MGTDKVEGLIGRLYTAFIARDLTFFVSGALVIAVVVQQPLDQITKTLSISGELPPWISVAALLALSYVLGAILQEAGRLILEPMQCLYVRSRGEVPPDSPEIVRRDALRKRVHSEQTYLAIERLVFLRQVAGTQFSSYVAILIALRLPGAPTCIPPLLVPLLGFGAGICIWVYLDKSHGLERVMSGLGNGKSPTKEAGSPVNTDNQGAPSSGAPSVPEGPATVSDPGVGAGPRPATPPGAPAAGRPA